MNKSQIAVNIFNKYADHYQSKFMNVDLYGDTFDFFCQGIKTKNAAILELACGPGNITKYLLNKRPDFKLLGTDLSPNMIELAKINNPTAEFEVMDCKEISSLNKKYDGIMCGFCLPYLSKEETEKLIADAHHILNSGGLLYISTMEDDYENSGWRKGSQDDEIFMHYYRGEYLIAVLEAANFKVVLEDRKFSEMTDGTKVIDLILIAENAKDIPSG